MANHLDKFFTMKPIKTILLAVALMSGGNAVAQDAQEFLFPDTKHTAFAGWGYARITNGIPDNVGGLSLDGLENGWAMRCGYNYNFNRKIGAGVLVDHSMNEKWVPYYDGSIKTEIGLTYLAPQFVFSVPFAPQSAWSFEARAGVGMLFVHQSAEAHTDDVDKKETANDTGWAMNAEIGVEWRLSKMVGLTAGLSDTFGQFREEYEDTSFVYKKWSNMNRFNVMVGLKVHF